MLVHQRVPKMLRFPMGFPHIFNAIRARRRWRRAVPRARRAAHRALTSDLSTRLRFQVLEILSLGFLGFIGIYCGLLWFFGIYWDLLWFIVVFWDLLGFIGIYCGLLWFIVSRCFDASGSILLESSKKKTIARGAGSWACRICGIGGGQT